MSLVGKPAPSITLPDANGESYTLTPGQGKVTVVFFYPKSGEHRSR
jgi:peroxiredoxin Q/BCP